MAPGLHRFLIMAVILLVSKTYCWASGGNPGTFHHFKYTNLSALILDTVLPKKINTGIQTDSGKTNSVIKEVPKSRKQSAPVALPVEVKVQPVKIIKPKIIKPVIKVK